MAYPDRELTCHDTNFFNGMPVERNARLQLPEWPIAVSQQEAQISETRATCCDFEPGPHCTISVISVPLVTPLDVPVTDNV